jgi:GR25 family glycosyltransferase involved in LPS biosynthesis
MKKICIIIVSSILFIIIIQWFILYTPSDNFIALDTIDNNKINFNLLLSPQYQITPINLYYINLDTSIDRKKRLLLRMSEFTNYNTIRVKAITPTDLSYYRIELPSHCIMTDKEKSCLLSHFKAIQQSYNNNDPYSIIAEDDIILEKNINWEYLISLLPNNWEIIQLYYFKYPFKNNSEFKLLQKKNFLIKTNNSLTSAAAYLINKKGMQNVLSHFNHNHLNLLNHTTMCPADYVIFHNTNRYILTYPIIKTEEIDSTLHTHHILFRMFYL